jgi:hypothetical protein
MSPDGEARLAEWVVVGVSAVFAGIMFWGIGREWFREWWRR